MFDLMSIIVPIIFIIVIGILFFLWGRELLRGIGIISHLDQSCQLLLLQREKILHIINMQMQGMRVEHTDSILQQTQCIM